MGQILLFVLFSSFQKSTAKELKLHNMNHSISSQVAQAGSKYEHRRASTLLRNIRNIRICMGKNPIFSVTYENRRISISIGFFPIQILIFLMLRNNADARRCSYFKLGLPVISENIVVVQVKNAE